MNQPSRQSRTVELTIDLHGAFIRRTNLSGANLTAANLESADCTGADFTGADLQYANLKNAILTGVRLVGANLDGAILDGADLKGADLTGVTNATADQLRSAIVDVRTTIPEPLMRELLSMKWRPPAT